MYERTNEKLGCLTGIGIVAALIAVVSIVGTAIFSGSQMFSAGELNAQAGKMYGGVTSHAQITKCSACHTAPWETATMAERCLACHADISEQMLNVMKLHGVITQATPGLSCRDCHPDHRGASASLIDPLRGAGFPHETLGFSLRGHKLKVTGEAFLCKDCHSGGTVWQQNDMMLSAVDSCDHCHRESDSAFVEKHVQTYGTDCYSCHSAHSSFAFRLDGKHADIPCLKCHPDARALADFQSAKSDCLSCHKEKDKHKGEFGAECGACHNPDSWENAKINHDLFDFPLQGEHLETKCESCHKNNVFKDTPQDCYSCHENDDEHGGDFGTQCEACHNPNDWDDADINHDVFDFPLRGEHDEVRCKSCHEDGVYKGTPKECYACHENDDEHNGRFGTLCEACHNPRDWDDADINHDMFAYKLEGAHNDVNCRDCHIDRVYKGTPTDCYSCHRNDDTHRGELGINCAECHTARNWQDVTENKP